MDIREYAAALRRRWVIVVAATLLGGIAAVLVCAFTQPKYESTSRLFVTAASGSSVADAYQGSLFLKDRVASYVQVATGRQVAAKVKDQLGLQESADEVRSMISAKNIEDSVLLDITATTSNPQLSKDVANAAATQTASMIKELETSARGGLPAASATILDAAEAPSSASSPKWPQSIAIGLIAGLAVGVVGALVRDRTDIKIRSTTDLEHHDVTPLGTLDTSNAAPDYESILQQLLVAGVTPGNRLVLAAPRSDAEAAVPELALGIARTMSDGNDAVVVVETHQCPSEIASNLGIEPAVGFSDVLSGSTSALEAVIPTDSPNVYVLPANSSHTTSDTLGSESLDNALKELDAHFKYIVLTAAPVLDDADAAILRRVSDGAVLVCRNGVTTKSDLLEAKSRLGSAANAQILGAVLVGAPARVLI